MKKKSSMSLAAKITIMIIIMVIICSVSVGVFVYRRIEADYYSLKGIQAQTAAASLASALDWRSIQIILETEEKNEYYEFIKETIIETGARMPDLAYTYMMSMQEPDFFIIYGQDPNAFIALDLGYLYPLEAMNLEKMSWTKETGGLLDKIAAHLLHSEFEEIVGVLRGKK